MPVKRLLAFGVTFLALACVSCFYGDCHDSPGNIVVVDNDPDMFKFTGELLNLTHTYNYDWECTRENANVKVTLVGMSGEVYVTLRDDDGYVVYEDHWIGPGIGTQEELSSDGAPGTWELTIEFSHVTGPVVIRATAQ